MRVLYVFTVVWCLPDLSFIFLRVSLPLATSLDSPLEQAGSIQWEFEMPKCNTVCHNFCHPDSNGLHCASSRRSEKSLILVQPRLPVVLIHAGGALLVTQIVASTCTLPHFYGSRDSMPVSRAMLNVSVQPLQRGCQFPCPE